MKNQKLKNLLLNTTIPILLSLVLFFPFKCLANYNESIVRVVEKKTIIDVAAIYLSFFFAIFIINVFFLLISYSIIKQGGLIKSRKFLKYIFLVAIGGFLIGLIIYNLSVTIFNDYLNYSAKILLEKFWMFIEFSVIFLPLFVYNYCLSRKFFNLTKKQAISIGVIVGVFTNIFLILFIYSLIF